MPPVQAGTEVEVGFQGMSVSGYIPEDGFNVIQEYGEMEELFDINGGTRTKVRTNPRKSWTGEMVIDSGTDWLLTEGDVISITPPSNDGSGGTPVLAEVQNGSQSTLNRKSIRLQITLMLEDSMTYTTSA